MLSKLHSLGLPGKGRLSPLRWVASLILFSTAGLKLLTLALRTSLLQSSDPFLGVPTWVILVAAASIELAIAALLLRPRHGNATAGSALLWFTACSMLYRIGSGLTSSAPCPCLGLLPQLLYWSTYATNWVTLSLLGVLALFGVILAANGRRTPT